MKRWIRFFQTRPCALLLLYWPFHSLWYEFLRRTHLPQESVWTVGCFLDEKIPFCEWFVIPYLSWYLGILGILLITLVTSKGDFLRTNALILSSLFLSMVFCTLVPNGIDPALRPDFQALGRENLLTKCVEWIYLLDSPPRNVFPSMHVSVAIAMYVSALRSERLLRGRFSRLFFGVWTLLIVCSTVFIKQHGILDVFAGVFVALSVIFFVFFVEKTCEKKGVI